MFVKDFMTRDLITVPGDAKAGPALQLLREQGLRRAPVVNASGAVIGLISDRRLLEALAVPVRRSQQQPAPHSAPSLLVRDLMNPRVVIVPPDMPMETAGGLMAVQRVGSLIVADQERPIGIITETDMARISLLLMIGREHGLRVTLRAPAFPGMLADVTTALARAGGNIISLGSMSLGDDTMITVKVSGLTEDDIAAITEELPVTEVHVLRV